MVKRRKTSLATAKKAFKNAQKGQSNAMKKLKANEKKGKALEKAWDKAHNKRQTAEYKYVDLKAKRKKR